MILNDNDKTEIADSSDIFVRALNLNFIYLEIDYSPEVLIYEVGVIHSTLPAQIYDLGRLLEQKYRKRSCVQKRRVE